jgi:hypothetical protein
MGVVLRLRERRWVVSLEWALPLLLGAGVGMVRESKSELGVCDSISLFVSLPDLFDVFDMALEDWRHERWSMEAWRCEKSPKQAMVAAASLRGWSDILGKTQCGNPLNVSRCTNISTIITQKGSGQRRMHFFGSTRRNIIRRMRRTLQLFLFPPSSGFLVSGWANQWWFGPSLG